MNSCHDCPIVQIIQKSIDDCLAKWLWPVLCQLGSSATFKRLVLAIATASTLNTFLHTYEKDHKPITFGQFRGRSFLEVFSEREALC